MLSQNWKATKNTALIAGIKAKLAKRCNTCRVSIHWVAGHAGVEGNEIADELANKGVSGSMAGGCADTYTASIRVLDARGAELPPRKPQTKAKEAGKRDVVDLTFEDDEEVGVGVGEDEEALARKRTLIDLAWDED